MPALDTNVLVRYVVEDDAAQLAAAKRLISRCVGEGLALFVPVTVVLDSSGCCGPTSPSRKTTRC